MIKKALISFVILLILVTVSGAEHLLGGEITWQCLGSGNYEFVLRLYRDCSSGTGVSDATLRVHNYPNLTSIKLRSPTKQEITPQCGGASLSCANGDVGAIEVYTFRSDPVTLTGIPPTEGWAFTYTDCCRGTQQNIKDANNQAFTLRARMFPYNGQNAGPCFDSSPGFAENPATIICSGVPFTYNHNAYDKELDSLVYSWAKPLGNFPGNDTVFSDVNPPAVPFESGYSFNSPLPGTDKDPMNVPASINPSTGEISYTSFTIGNYATAVKVQAYKCGQLVSEIFRELPVVLLSCGANAQPAIKPPFQDGSGAFTLFSDTVYAGDLVTFNIEGSDSDTPAQQITLSASGGQFGSGFTNTASGCLKPPCATLNPPPSISVNGTVTTQFSWQTTCDHISLQGNCLAQSNTYTFVVKVQDDFCPAPSIKIGTVSITVLSPPVLDPPSLRCVSVNNTNDVVLNWVQPPDPDGAFNSYHIYVSNSATGRFTILDSISNFNQTSYTHVNAKADKNDLYYFVKTRSGCDGRILSKAGDTLQAIRLEVTAPGNGTAELNWNSLADPVPATASQWYKIYREMPAGTWNLIDSTTNTYYSDTIAWCKPQNVNYRIEVSDQSGCVSVSSVDGSLLHDNFVPDVPVLDSISVNALAQATLGWEPAIAGDVEGYIIYQLSSGIWLPIDTVYGRNNTFYSNALSSADIGPEEYRIAAFDSCMNTSPLGDAQSSIHLMTNLDNCARQNTLTWSSYKNIPSGLQEYLIMVSKNGGPLLEIESVTPGTGMYIHEQLEPFAQYCYIIRAVNNNGDITATSNEVCDYMDYPQPPAWAYLNVATVLNSHAVQLECMSDPTANVEEFVFYRSTSNDGIFSEVGRVPGNGRSQVTFQDKDVDTFEKSYYYKVSLIDSCGAEILTTNIGRTILLTATAQDGFVNDLNWNDYEDWLGSVDEYYIYRSVDGQWDPLPIKVVSFGETFYSDDIEDILADRGEFCYYIEAVEGPGNPHGVADTSRSNISCAIQAPRVFVPNAFTPNGKNKTFKPVHIYLDPAGYLFAIYDKWGREIFKTDDPNEAWDGKFNDGDEAKQDSYVWYLRIVAQNDEGVIERTGTVLLLR